MGEGSGVINVGTAGTDGRCRHISETTFNGGTFFKTFETRSYKINFIILILLCILLSVSISLLKSLLILGTLTS